MKQLEKFEQKMKEERQKRIRERQNEFFREVEIHKWVLLCNYLETFHLSFPFNESAFNIYSNLVVIFFVLCFSC